MSDNSSKFNNGYALLIGVEQTKNELKLLQSFFQLSSDI